MGPHLSKSDNANNLHVHRKPTTTANVLSSKPLVRSSIAKPVIKLPPAGLPLRPGVPNATRPLNHVPIPGTSSRAPQPLKTAQNPPRKNPVKPPEKKLSKSAQLAAKTAQIQVLEDKVRVLTAELNKCRNERDSSRNDLRTKTNELAKEASLRKIAEATAEVKQKRVAELNLQITRLNGDSRRAAHLSTNLQGQIRNFQDQLRTATQAANNKEQTIQALKDDLKRVTEELRKSKEELRVARIGAVGEEAVAAAPIKDDCPYYYRPEGCLIGDACPLRHSVLAKDSFQTCPTWAQGGCNEFALCLARHMTQERIDEERAKYYGAHGGGGGDAAAGGPQPKRARAEDKGLECPVCMEDGTSVTKWKSMVCGHILCEGCSNKCWGKKGPKTCPICKRVSRYRPKELYLN